MSIKELPPQLESSMLQENGPVHVPVLLDAVCDVLKPQKGESYLDLTAGYGGHARRILEVTENIPFNTIPGEDKPLTLYKKDKTVITVVDSRTIKTNWKLYIFFVNPMIEMNGKVLVDSLFFKKFNS